MQTDTMSEPTFLITELRYTLGQLHVQLGDLDSNVRGQECEGTSIQGVVDEMTADEDRYQKRYAQLLGINIPQGHGETGFLGQTDFEKKRSRTVAMLEQTGTDWEPGLTETVREQIAADRRRTTQIADCRKAIFGQDQRPDLNEPLTTGQ